MKLVCEQNHLLGAGSYWCHECNRAYAPEQLFAVYDPGEFVDRWEVAERLLVLPMCVMYRVRDRNKRALLKIARHGFEENLKREGRLLAQMTGHPLFPTLIATGEGKSNPYSKVAQGKSVHYYLLFEDPRGIFLRDKLARQSRLPTTYAGWLAIGLAEGILELTNAGRALNLLHPDAILVCDDPAGVPRPVLLDWMASSRIGAQPLLNGVVTPHLPPELLDGGLSQPQTDVYAVGALLYELLSGAALFGVQPMTPAKLKQAVMRTLPGSLNELRPDVRPEIAHTVMQSVEKNLEKRTLSLEMLLSELVRYFGEPPVPRRVSVLNTRMFAIGLIIAIAMCSIALIIALSGT